MPISAEGRARQLANLKPAMDSERAKELGRLSGERRRERARQREQASREELARLAYRRLYELLEGSDKRLWTRAITEALDRAEGKPTQHVETTDAVPAHDLTPEQVRDELRRRLRLLEGGSEQVV